MQIDQDAIATAMEHYIIAMLWSTMDESDEDGGEPMDQNYSRADLAPGQIEEIEKDVTAFLKSVGHLITESNYTGAGRGQDALAYAGHDLWLTRAGHGAGFWDGDWASDAHSGLEGPLTQAAKALGEVWPYIGDDGQVYHS